MIAALLIGCLSFQDPAPALEPIETLLAHPALVSGDLAQLAEDWTAALEADPDGPLALDFLQALTSLRRLDSQALDGDRLLALYARLGGARERDVAGRLLEAEQLRRMFGTDVLELPDDLYAEYLDQWQVLGPMGATDHQRPSHMALQGPTPATDPGGEFRSAWGEVLHWQAETREKAETGINVAWSVWPQGGISFLRARVRGHTGAAWLELNQSGSVQGWWNGQYLGRQQEVGFFGTPRRLRVRVNLEQEAWSTLLLSLPTVDGGVAARFVDDEGQPLEVECWSAALGAAPEVLSEGAALGELEAAPERALPEHELAPALAVRRAAGLGRADRALALASHEGASERARAVFLNERHRVLATCDHLPEEILRRRLLEVEAELEQLGGVRLRVHLERIKRLLAEDQPAAALSIWDSLQASVVDMPLLRLSRISVLLDLDPVGSLGQEALLDTAESFPDHPRARATLASLLEQAGDRSGALELAWQALVLNGANQSVRSLVLASLAEKPGDPRRTVLLDVARRWRQQRPADARGRAFELAALSVVDAQEALLERLRERAQEYPGLPHVWRALASYHLEHGEDGPARAALARYLEFLPGDPWAREAGAALGIEDPASLFFEAMAADASEALAAAAGASDASTAEALDAGLIYLYPDGSGAERTHSLTVALDRKGTEELHERAANGRARLARVLQKGGGIAEPVQVDGKWVMPSLDPGDAVELIYDQRFGGGRGNVPQLGRWSFCSLEKPFVRSYYAVFVPDSLGGELRTGHFDGRREARRVEGGTIHVLRADDRPRVAQEAFMPSYVEILPWAQYGSDQDLDVIVENWRGRLEDLSECPADLALELDEFLASRTWPEPMADKARALWDALEERTIDFRGNPFPGGVWYLRRGNPIFLYQILLDRAGVPVEMGLMERPVSAALDQNPVQPFAYANGLDRPVLRIGGPDAEQVLWQVMPISRGTPFAYVPGNLAGVKVVLVGQAGYRHEDLPSTGLEREWDVDLDLTWRLAADGSALVQGTIAVTTEQGAVLLEQLRQAPANQRDRFARSIVGSLVPGMDLATWNVPALASDSQSQSFSLEFSGQAPDAVQRTTSGAQMSLRLPPTGLSTSLGPARRNWMLAMRASNRARVRVRVETGEHWEVEAGPAGFLAEREGYKHLLEATVGVDGVLDVTRIFVVRGLTVEPAEMAAFLDRAGELEREESSPVRLKELP
ncbi:MAG: hypothetical protein ACI8QC_001516 [Planctomycetota bacterium]